MKKSNQYFLIHVSAFIFCHFFGLLRTAIEISNIGIGESNFTFFESGINLSIFHIAQYLLISILLSVFFIYSCFSITQKINKFYDDNPYLLHIFIALIINISLIQLNHNYYPDSYHSGFNALTNVNNALLIAIVFLPSLYVITSLSFQYQKLSIAILFASLVFLFPSATHKLKPIKKDMIIIGIDSLRPELINAYMPFLSRQLDSSTILENAITPFARTYPAWMSILTGKYPVNHNARFNLQDEKTLNPNNIYLPNEFKSMGYQTAYASDERRFSNLGEIQGFERVIGPRTGVSDFVLGNYADYPLSNLVLNIPIAYFLFPEIYANRAAQKLYSPERFNYLLDKKINDLSTKKPLFLAVHFCLAHWPYTYVGHKRTPEYSDKPEYPEALVALDQQIKDLFISLEKRGDESTRKFVFLSDHGESWGTINTGLKNKSDHNLTITDFGHGMNILSHTSHNILIAFKNFDKKIQSQSRLASLTDIRPSILDEMGFFSTTDKTSYDGVSLFRNTSQPRAIILESGLVIAAANKKTPDVASLAKNHASRFEILPSGLLRLKSRRVEELISKKQIGVRNQDLGFYMGYLINEKKSKILIDYKLETYKEIFSIQQLSKASHTLATELCKRYSKNHPDVKDFCVNY